MRRTRSTPLVLAALCGLAFAGSSGCKVLDDLLGSIAELIGLDKHTPCGLSYRYILRAADRRAKQQDPDAVVFEVTGNNVGTFQGTGACTMTYVFLAADPNDGTSMWRLTYDRLTNNWQVESLVGTPVVGVAFLDLTTIERTEEEARAILAANGFGQDFVSWGLSRVLYPDAPPVFSFVYNNATIVIDAVSNLVTYQAVTPDGTGGEPPTTPGDDSVSLQMVQAATTRIQETARSAFVLWAGGRDASGAQLSHPGDTNHWDFYAAANPDGDLRVWTMAYDGAWNVTEIDIVPFGIELIDINTVTMDVVEAWALAEHAGHRPPFDWWVLFKPIHPNALHPLYAFGMPYGYVFVDTATGEVTEEVAARNALGDCLYGCRESYFECVDYCHAEEPGSGDCYDDCADSRDRCDQACYDED